MQDMIRMETDKEFSKQNHLKIVPITGKFYNLLQNTS